MAIITDATGRQLAQAVGGIDTGGLAKDTTLQATNTALGNMNTTQQNIASAISGLGATLGSDKVNIDGSNIANPVAFRQNIGIHIDVDVSCTSNASAYAPTGLSTQLYTLVQAYANGILTIPFDGGDGNWYMLFLKPSDMSRYANLNRSCTLIYIDN